MSRLIHMRIRLRAPRLLRQFLNYKTLLPLSAIEILGGTIYYIIGKGTVYIPLLMDNGSIYTVATEAFYILKLPYKFLLKLVFKKCK